MGASDRFQGTKSIERIILEAVGIGTWEWWLPENTVHYDEVWCRQLGKDPRSVRHDFETWRSAVHPEDLPGAMAAVNRHLEGKTEEFWFVVRMKHQDGRWLSIRSQGRCLKRDLDGHPLQVAGTHVDVSADVEREELSNKIQSLARLGGWELDVATQRTKWTQETYRIHRIPYDTPTDKIMGISFYAEKDRPRIQQQLETLISIGTPFQDNFQFIDASGVEKVVRVSGEPIFGSDGKISKVRGIIQDVTEEIRRQKEKEDLRRQLLEAQTVARIGSWSYDLKTERSLWSDMMYDLYPSDISYGPLSVREQISVVHPEDRESYSLAFRNAVEKGASFRLRYRVLKTGSKELWIDGICHALKGEDGTVRQLYGTSQDITDLVIAEQRLQEERSKALHTSKLASLGEMSAGIAHEINNPLALILGTASLLPKYAGDLAGLTKKAEVIVSAGSRIDRIVNALKKYARTNERSVHTIHSLTELMREAVVLVENKARRSGVRLDVNFDGGPSVHGDGAEIVQVIVNLLSNAIDAAKLEPTKWVKVSALTESGAVVLQVEDSGAGIPSAMADKIFQPFFSTKPAGEGTGLGLSIVKGILDEHSATIEVTSPQNPTRFEVRFPVVGGVNDVP